MKPVRSASLTEAANSSSSWSISTDWLAQERDTALAPPKFCPNADLLSELLYDSSIGHRPLSHCSLNEI
jgi:hypothetical protein